MYHQDSEGTRLEVGQVVAANVSGNVRRGKIVKLTTIIHVQLLGDGYLGKGHVSKIKNDRSVLVLIPAPKEIEFHVG